MKAFLRILTVIFIVSMFVCGGSAQASTWNLNKPLAQSTGKMTSFVVKADFNGDGIMDLASCTRQNPGKVTILLGKGDGKFTKKVTFNSGKRPVSMVAGDFNGDGFVDLAVVNWGDDVVNNTPPANPGNVIVYLGNGDGTLNTTGTSYSVGTNPVYIVSADLTSKGKTDLVVANWGSDSISVLLHNSTPGTFDVQPPIPVGSHPRSIAVGDIDKVLDGITNKYYVDIVVANWSNDTVSLLHGNGDGTFAFDASTDIFNVGKNPVSVALGYLNEDDYLDIVTANFDTNDVSALMSDGSGGFKPVEFLAAGSGPSFVLVKDIDGDGNQDIITCNGIMNNMSLFQGFGDGTFQVRKDFMAGSYPAEALLSDLNNDGGWDLITANVNSGNISVFTAKNKKEGDWNFVAGGIAPTVSPTPPTLAAPSTPLTSPTSVFAADLNRDELTDVIATAKNDDRAFVMLNDGKGLLSVKSVLTTGTSPESATAADFTGDGIKDIAIANSGIDNTISIFKGNGDGTYGVGPAISTGTTIPTGTTPVSVISGDFDKDGKMDLAVCNSADNTVSVFLGKGDGTFYTAIPKLSPTTTLVFPVGTNPQKVVAGDFNGDGILDLAVANQGTILISGNVSILIGNGDGTFRPAVNYPAGTGPVSLAAVDLNADKRPDLAVLDSDGNVSILMNTGAGIFRAPTSFATGASPTSIAAADLNLDGLPDIVVVAADGVSVYFGKGSGLFGLFAGSPLKKANNIDTLLGVSAVISEFNKDGKADLAVASSTDSGIYVVKGIDQVNFEINVNVISNGTVTVAPSATALDLLTPIPFEGGKTISLKANPADGFYFKNWSDGFSGTDNPRLMLVTATMKDKIALATFETGPSISSLDSFQGVLKDTITISGSNFGSTKGTVSLGSTSATIGTWSDTTITFTVPINIASNKYKLHVTAGSKTSNSVDFYILKAYIASSDSATANKGDSVTLTGVNFGPDIVTVALYPIDGITGTNARVTSFVTPFTSVTFTVPGVTAGDYIIKVKNTNGYSNGFPITIN